MIIRFFASFDVPLGPGVFAELCGQTSQQSTQEDQEGTLGRGNSFCAKIRIMDGNAVELVPLFTTWVVHMVAFDEGVMSDSGN